MLLILDPGHGGCAAGHYFTQGKRSPEVPPGIYEGEFNRDMCKQIENEVYYTGGLDEIWPVNIAPGIFNIPLDDRIGMVNTLIEKQPGILISIHANASGNEWSNAQGSVVFRARNADRDSIKLSELINGRLRQYTTATGIKTRGVKEAGFKIFRVKCPAVLVECGFMTNKAEVQRLQDPHVQETLAKAIVEAVAEYMR